MPTSGDTWRRRVFLLLIVAAFAGDAGAEVLSGRVVAIQDGDTLTLLTQSKQQLRVRLVSIDAPESGQPYGRRSKQVLSDMVFNREVRIESAGLDRYGRTLGRVYVKNHGDITYSDVNAILVGQGAAWVYRQYNSDPQLLALEAEAQAARRGLWALQADQRCPPWEWRRNRCVKNSPASCGAKRTCREMVSCEEARFYLETCGVARLDGDKDGVPCEQLCR